MKGKNFSCNNVGQRKESDFYETPYSMVHQLLDNVRLIEPILEPACGKGAIVKTLKQREYKNITSYDLSQGHDFLAETRQFRTILSNPPFSLAKEFIYRGLLVAPDVWYLLPLSYLHGKTRYDTLYRKGALKEVFIFTRYALLGAPLREDGEYPAGMIVYAWFHFTQGVIKYPTMNWIDNDAYILTAKDRGTP
jgi:hypothetical protein